MPSSVIGPSSTPSASSPSGPDTLVPVEPPPSSTAAVLPAAIVVAPSSAPSVVGDASVPSSEQPVVTTNASTRTRRRMPGVSHDRRGLRKHRPLRRILGLHAAVAAKVHHREALAHERRRHEHAPMTVCRVLLGTQDRRRSLARDRDELRDAGLELGRSRPPCRIERTVGVVPVAPGPPAELGPEKSVVDPRLLERTRQIASAKLRRPPRRRLRAHIDEHLDPLRLQECHEAIDRMAAVPDREDRRLRYARHGSLFSTSSGGVLGSLSRSSVRAHTPSLQTGVTFHSHAIIVQATASQFFSLCLAIAASFCVLATESCQPPLQ